MDKKYCSDRLVGMVLHQRFVCIVGEEELKDITHNRYSTETIIKQSRASYPGRKGIKKNEYQSAFIVPVVECRRENLLIICYGTWFILHILIL